MNSTRKDYGSALAILARLYRTAERDGDVARARRYAVAVDLLLGAWPSDADAACEHAAGSRAGTRAGGWPTTESTLIGVGAVQ